MFSEERLSLIFGNIESIYSFAQKFLSQLEVCIDVCPHLSEIGQSFLDNVRFLLSKANQYMYVKWMSSSFTGLAEAWKVLEKSLNLKGFLEKSLNLEGFIEKPLKIESVLKSTGKSLKSLEKSLNSTISVGLSTCDRDLNQYKNSVPLFGAAYAASNIGTTILY